MRHHRPSYAHLSNAQLAATAATATQKRRQIRREIIALQHQIVALQRQDTNHWRQWALTSDLLAWRTRSGETSRDIFVEYEALKRRINDETPDEERPIITAFQGTWQEPEPKRRRSKKHQQTQENEQQPADTTWTVTLTWPDGSSTTLLFSPVYYVHMRNSPSPIGGRIIIVYDDGGYIFRFRNGDGNYGEVNVSASLLNITYS